MKEGRRCRGSSRGREIRRRRERRWRRLHRGVRATRSSLANLLRGAVGGPRSRDVRAGRPALRFRAAFGGRGRTKRDVMLARAPSSSAYVRSFSASRSFARVCSRRRRRMGMPSVLPRTSTGACSTKLGAPTGHRRPAARRSPQGSTPSAARPCDGRGSARSTSRCEARRRQRALGECIERVERQRSVLRRARRGALRVPERRCSARKMRDDFRQLVGGKRGDELQRQRRPRLGARVVSPEDDRVPRRGRPKE